MDLAQGQNHLRLRQDLFDMYKKMAILRGQALPSSGDWVERWNFFLKSRSFADIR